MTRFTKKPLYQNKNKPMRNKTNIIWAILILTILLLGIYTIWNYQYTNQLKSTLIDTTSAYERAIQPSELEELTIELGHNRIERQELQKVIDEKVEQKKVKAQRADEIQERIIEITGLR